MKIAVPMAFTQLLERSAFWITWSMVGQLGADFLGPVSLAASVLNVFGMAITIGLNIAVSTLASQAAGARDDLALGLVLQRAIPINAAFCLPVMLILLTLQPILLAFGMDEVFAHRAGSYAWCLLPTPILTGLLRAMQSWLASMGITRPQALVSLALLPCHALLCYLLIYKTPLGYRGAGVAMTLAMMTRVALLYGYIRHAPRCRRAYKGFDCANAFSGWASYLSLALPGVLILSEYW